MYIIDTHVFIWFASKETIKIPKQILNILETEPKIFISVASVWEISIKTNLNKLELGFNFFDIERILASNNISVLSIDISHVKVNYTLPSFHKDPFDRILIAQAITQDYTIITKDEFIKNYDVKTLW